jgi:hypothetical protein
MNNSTSVESRPCNKRKRCNFYHQCFPNNSNNEVMRLCQLNPIAKCLSCKGEKGFGGFFCSRNECSNFVGDILSRIYRRLCGNLIYFRQNKDEDEMTISSDPNAMEERSINRIIDKMKTIAALDGCYSGEEMVLKIKELQDKKLIHYDHVKDLYRNVRYHGYYMAKELFQNMCEDKMHNFVDSFDSYFNHRHDNLQIAAHDVLDSVYLPSFIHEDYSDSDNDSNN